MANGVWIKTISIYWTVQAETWYCAGRSIWLDFVWSHDYLCTWRPGYEAWLRPPHPVLLRFHSEPSDREWHVPPPCSPSVYKISRTSKMRHASVELRPNWVSPNHTSVWFFCRNVWTARRLPLSRSSRFQSGLSFHSKQDCVKLTDPISIALGGRA